MGIVYNSSKLGSLFTNGDFETGSNANFTFSSVSSSQGRGGSYGLIMQTNNQHVQGSQYVEVDTSKYYRMTVDTKTILRSSPNNYLGSGYLGFATYDQFYNFVDLRHCGGVGNTTLTRTLNPGDSYAYVASVSGWSTSTTYYFRHLMFNPATHPYYSTPWGYSRIGYGDVNICHANTWTWTGSDYQVAIQNTSNVNMTMPNVGYALPAGTPVFTGQAGGTYSYVFGNPSHPEYWNRYDSGWFTGENRNSSLPFRHGTKYIRFMVLSNYARSETISAQYIFDNIRLYGPSPTNNKTLPT